MGIYNLHMPLPPNAVVSLGALPPGRVFLVVRVARLSAQSMEIRLFVNNDDANAGTPEDDPHFAGTVGVFGLGMPLERLPLESPMRAGGAAKEHRIDITRVVDRVVPRRTDVRVKLVAVSLEEAPIAAEELPIESITVDIE
jgi:hypothetical protein